MINDSLGWNPQIHLRSLGKISAQNGFETLGNLLSIYADSTIASGDVEFTFFPYDLALRWKTAIPLSSGASPLHVIDVTLTAPHIVGSLGKSEKMDHVMAQLVTLLQKWTVA